jgi:hypothetical protein
MNTCTTWHKPDAPSTHATPSSSDYHALPYTLSEYVCHQEIQ